MNRRKQHSVAKAVREQRREWGAQLDSAYRLGASMADLRQLVAVLPFGARVKCPVREAREVLVPAKVKGTIRIDGFTASTKVPGFFGEITFGSSQGFGDSPGYAVRTIHAHPTACPLCLGVGLLRR